MLYTDDRRGVRLRCRRVYVSVYVQNVTGGFFPFLWLRKFTEDHITNFKTMTIIKIFQVTFKFCDIADQKHCFFFIIGV